jgi:PAS domain S-box-containing protein
METAPTTPELDRAQLKEMTARLARKGEELTAAKTRLDTLTRDIRRSSEDLRESERRYGDMVNNLELIAVMVDGEGLLLDCNPCFLRLTGWHRSEVIGKNWFEQFIPPEQHEVRARLSTLLRDAPPAWHYENQILTRAGERLCVRWNNTVLRARSGEVIGTASIGEDITQRKMAEDEVRRLNADLERRVSDRTAELRAANRELEAFDYSISHDLRAPLNRIECFCAMLGEQYGEKLGAQGTELLQRIAAAGRGMDLLVADLLALSTVTHGELQRSRVDLGEMGRSIVASLNKSEPGRAVRVDAQERLSVEADPGLVRIVLENLIGNAWKFTRSRSQAHIEIGCLDTASERVFFVRDDGVGFDMAHAGEVFTPFRRLHSRAEYEGTGIGLATVQRIVRRHGGRVWAEAVVDGGATVFFTLSCASPRTMPELTPPG